MWVCSFIVLIIHLMPLLCCSGVRSSLWLLLLLLLLMLMLLLFLLSMSLFYETRSSLSAFQFFALTYIVFFIARREKLTLLGFIINDHHLQQMEKVAKNWGGVSSQRRSRFQRATRSLATFVRSHHSFRSLAPQRSAVGRALDDDFRNTLAPSTFHVPLI